MKLENTLFTLGALGSISAALVIPNLENAADHHELINKEDHHERPRKVEFTKDDDEEPSDSEDKEDGKFHKKGRKGQDKESPEFNGKRARGSHGSAHEGGKGMKPKHESSNNDDNDDKKKKPHHKGGCHENKVEEKKVKGKKVKGKKHHEKTLEKGRHHNRLAPLVSTAQFNPDAISKIIPNRYIIVFKRGAPQEEIDFHKENVQQAQLQSVENLSAEDAFFISTKDASLSTSEAGGIQDSFNIDNLFSGYIGYFTQEIVDLIRQNPLVDFVERDSIVEATEFDTQNSAPWGLARISHRERLNLGSFNKYLYDDDAGRGVTSYVIDTGVNHQPQGLRKESHLGENHPT